MARQPARTRLNAGYVWLLALHVSLAGCDIQPRHNSDTPGYWQAYVLPARLTALSKRGRWCASLKLLNRAEQDVRQPVVLGAGRERIERYCTSDTTGDVADDTMLEILRNQP